MKQLLIELLFLGIAIVLVLFFTVLLRPYLI